MTRGPENGLPHQKSTDGTKIVRKLIAKSPDLDGFDDLTDEDFAEIQRSNAEMYGEEESIEKELTYTPFDPEVELKNLQKLLPHEESLSDIEKRGIYEKRLVNYKESLMHQKEGVAKTVDTLFKIVESKPETSEEELLTIVEEFAQEYKFIPDYFKDSIKQYIEKHSQVERYRKIYPEDSDLFEASFGAKPEGKIEIIKGPMTLYFRCYNERDYAFICDFAEHKGNKDKFEFENYITENRSGGIGSLNCLIDDLSGTIAAENIGLTSNSERVRVHEIQHQFNGLFTRNEVRYGKLETIEQILSSKNNTKEELTQKLIRGYLRLERKNLDIDTNARDEILAFYKDGRDTETIFNLLANSKLYDYKERDHKKYITTIPALIKEELAHDIAEITSVVKGEEEIERISEQDLDISVLEVIAQIKPIFDVEYKKDLSEWLQSITLLEQKGYSRDEVISFLYSEPAYAWSKLAKRMPIKK